MTSPDPSPRRIYLTAGLVAAMLASGTISARADLCTEVTGLIARAEANFTGSDTPPTALTGAESCTQTRALSGARAFHCAWPYPFRDGDAKAAFKAVNSALAACFRNRTTAGRDLGVNHPDSYDQRQYTIGRVLVTASIKDKSAEQKTYVFVGVHGPARE